MAEAVEIVKEKTETPSEPNTNEAQKNPLQERVENIDQGKQKSSQIEHDVGLNQHKKKKKKPKPVKQISYVSPGAMKKIVRPVVPSYEMSFQLSEHQQYVCQQHHIAIKSSKFVCELCSSNICTWSYLEQHVSSSSHMRALEDSLDTMGVKLLPAPLDRQKEVLGDLIKRIVTMVHDMNKLSERKAVATSISQSISKSFPGCTAKLYGSLLYLAGLATSDININITIPSSLNLPSTMMAIFEHLEKDEMKKNVEFKMSTSITSITFQDVNSELQCGISFNNSHSCEVAQIIATYLSLDERAWILATAFRYWANLCCLDQIDYGTLPAHAFPILVIYYLQQLEDPVLPVLGLQEIRKEDTSLPEIFDPHQLNIRWKTENKMSLGELWIGLFKFYVLDFDVSEKVVSIQSKKPVYQNSKKWSCRRFGIEDPVTRDKNIAKTLVNLRSVHYFLHCLRTSATYFATPQVQGMPIFRRVQLLPPGMHRLTHLLNERDVFLNYIFMCHPFFLTEEQLKEKNMHHILKPDHPNFSTVGKFIVTPDQAIAMFQKFNPANLYYEFNVKYFKCGKERPVICVFCREEGHYKDRCPLDSLPPLEKLPHLPESYLNKLSEMCEAIYDTWSLTPSELAARESVVSHLFKYLQPKFPDIALTLFGSSCNGFGLKRSDIDICFTFTTCPPGEDLDFAKLIQDLYGLLKSYSPFTNLVPITTAKVPILKFLHVGTELDGDISFHNTLALKNTELISTYSTIDKRAKVLGYVVKRFAKVSRICDASKGSLSSYAYILMMIHFLQQCHPPVLPVLQEIGKSCSTEEHILEDCDVYYFADLERLPDLWPEYGENTKSVGELWIEFLCYYTEVFDFNKCVIAIRKNRLLTKFEKLWNGKSMAIEDPFDVGHNLGIGLSLKMHQYILKAFRNGRMYFSTEKNMPSIKPLSKGAEKYFEGSKVKGSPPDRGCHHCKKIGHVMKDCPVRQQRKDNSVTREYQREYQRDRPVQSPKSTKPYKPMFRGNPNLDVGLVQETSQHEKGRRTTWWNQSIPTPQPVVHYVSKSHWKPLPAPLNRVNAGAEIGMQVQALAQKWQARPENNKFLQRKEKKMNIYQSPPPKNNSGEVIDVYTQPAENLVSEIPSVEFYNKTAHSPSKFQG